MNVTRLRVYQAAHELLTRILELCDRLPKKWDWLTRHVKESGGSVVLNIREGWQTLQG